MTKRQKKIENGITKHTEIWYEDCMGTPHKTLKEARKAQKHIEENGL